MIRFDYTFPFGEKVRPVLQTDRAAKEVFVLGVYASAVHAKWISPDGNMIVKAFAVASEPNIFWRGEGAKEIVRDINIPPKLGHLEAADSLLNGPSGRTLDERFLQPLGVSRDNAWLCDLVPHTCLNKAQKKAIQEKYNPIRAKYDLPKVTLPEVPEVLAGDVRRREIMDEIHLARPKLAVLLGDQPIKWFVNPMTGQRGTRLSDFVTPETPYGQIRTLSIGSERLNFLFLVHPR